MRGTDVGVPPGGRGRLVEEDGWLAAEREGDEGVGSFAVMATQPRPRPP